MREKGSAPHAEKPGRKGGGVLCMRALDCSTHLAGTANGPRGGGGGGVGAIGGRDKCARVWDGRVRVCVCGRMANWGFPQGRSKDREGGAGSQRCGGDSKRQQPTRPEISCS